MTSTIKIKKICEWCGEAFIAQKTTTRCCSHKCSSQAYKNAKRKKLVQEAETKTETQIATRPQNSVKDKDFLSFAEAAVLLGITRQAIYKMVNRGNLKASRISSRLSFIRRADIESMLEDKPYTKLSLKTKTPITEFYTTAEIIEKYNISESWIFSIAKKNRIPKTHSRGKTYWSKKHIDNYFAKKAPDPEITEWYSVSEIQEKFSMNTQAIYALASNEAIPKKRDGRTVYYSKLHFDIAKGVAEPQQPQYYTVAETMEKYNLSRDQLYHYVKRYGIPKQQEGRYIKISKPELDKLFESPIIE